MSYILDALRRADAERERGAVPSLHAQPVADGADEEPPSRQGRLVAVVVGLALLLAGSLAWQWFGRDTPVESVSMAPPPAVVAAPPAAATTPPQPSTVDETAAAASAGSLAEPAFTGAPPAQVLAAPAPVPMRPAVMAPLSARRTEPASAQAAATTSSGAGLSPAATAEARPAPLGELPPELRRELPQLVVGGSIYSQDPASRFVIINGQLYHERDKVGPGLVVEQIELKSAVLSYKGYRFSISY